MQHTANRAGRPAVVLLLLVISTPAAWAQLAPLQDATCKMTRELRGVRGHALFRYFVSPEGTVENVTELYATAEPTSQEAAFTAVLSDCLKSWRYRPAVFMGKTISTRMLMAFHYFEPAPYAAPSISTPGGGTIPLLHFDIMRKEKLKLASQLLAGADRAEIPREGWAVLTNVAASQRKELIDAIEHAHVAFGSVFPAAPSLPESSRLTVLLFRSEHAFNQVASFDNLLRMERGIAGQYSPYQQTAYTALGNKPVRIAIATLVHETTHHLVHQRLFQDGRQPPYWVSEGIATFMELLRVGKTLDPSRFRRGKQSEGDYQWIAQADTYLGALKRAGRAGTLPDLGAFLSSSPELGPIDSDIAYGLSWLLVHFLINGEQGRHRENFQSWLLATADWGEGESLVRALEMTVPDLEEALTRGTSLQYQLV